MPIYIPPKRILTRQPQGSFEVDFSSPYTRGIKRIIVPGCNVYPTSSQYEKYESVSFETNKDGVVANCLISASITEDLGITFPVWENTTNEASAVIYESRNPGSTENSGWHNLGRGDLGSHFPWAGSAYSDAFSTDRWIANTLPAGMAFDTPHIVGFSAKTYDHTAFLNGKVWVTGNANTFGLPATKFRLLCCKTLPGNNYQAPFGGYLYLAIFWDRKLDNNELAELTTNPWQIFKSLPKYFFISEGGSTVTGTGSISACSLSAVGSSASVNSQTSSSLAQASLSAPTGLSTASSLEQSSIANLSLSGVGASASVVAQASNSLPQASLSAPIVSANALSLASTAIAPLSVSAVNGSASVNTQALGAISQISFSAPNCAAVTVGTGIATGSIANLSLSTITANGVVSTIAVTALSQAALNAPTCIATTSSDGVANALIAPLSLSAVNVSASAIVTAIGSLPILSLGVVSGSASGIDGKLASGYIQGIDLSAVSASANVSVDALASIMPLSLIAPYGIATTGGDVSSYVMTGNVEIKEAISANQFINAALSAIIRIN